MLLDSEIVLAVLNSPVEMSSGAIARELGTTKETVRKIRLGLTYSSLFPQFERLKIEQMTLSCEDCTFFARKSRRQSWCDFGYPEATNAKFARGCSTYLGRGVKE